MWTDSTWGVLVLRLAVLAGMTALLTANLLRDVGI